MLQLEDISVDELILFYLSMVPKSDFDYQFFVVVVAHVLVLAFIFAVIIDVVQWWRVNAVVTFLA